MQKIIDQITDNLSGLIKDDLPAYTPKELLRSGIPSFIVERMRLITEDLLRAELDKPESIWASMDNKLVSHAWEDYVDCVISSSHIPKEFLYETLSVVVKEVVEVLLEPRRKMADYLFRNFDSLRYDEVNRRCARLTIYKHIGMAIPMYMKKKGLKEITRERCKNLIHSLDEKLVANYTPDDWADKLEMLFIIFGGKVDPAMFVTFFKDKGLNRAARIFSALKDPLSRRDFISLLSKEGSEDLVGDESDDEFLEKVKEGSVKDKEEELVDSFFGEYEVEEEEPLVKQFTKEEDISEKEMAALLKDIEKEEESFDSESLNALFSGADGEEADAEKIVSSEDRSDEEKQEFRSNLASILEQAKSSYESIGSEEQDHEAEAEDEVLEMSELVEEEEEPSTEEVQEEVLTSEGDAEETEDGDAPMWKQYLSEEQMEVMMGSRKKQEDQNEDPEANDKGGLLAVLGDQADHFRKEIFGGSKKKFERAMADIDEFLAWGQASEYLQTNVFDKNKIDMFSDEAVEFTDFLQNYFNEHK